jgi:surface antigen
MGVRPAAAAVCLAMLLTVGVGSADGKSVARRTNASRIAWQTHAGAVRQGRTIALTLDREVRAACSLTISAAGEPARAFRYAEDANPIQFAIKPSRRTRSESWRLTATCVAYGRVSAQHATTHLRVIGSARGSGFLVNRSGPSFEVNVPYGKVRKIAPLPTGGRGGDPGNDYPWATKPQDSGYDPWGEEYRECTSFVAWALHSRNDYNMPFHADAYLWGIKAAQLGIAVNHTPSVGSVAWEPQLPGHYFGHVMWVSAVSGQMVTVEEYNEHGNGTYDKRTFNVSSEPYQYIHFKDLSYTPPTVPTPAPPTTSPTTPPAASTAGTETAGSVANTWTNYAYADGTEGPSIGAGQAVQVSCKVTGFAVADGNTWWYQIASSPWNDSYYVSADAFYNDGATSGSLTNTPFVDNSISTCAPSTTTPTPIPTPTPSPAPTPSPTPTPTPTTYGETTGSVAHTWTNYSNAGGNEGPDVANNQTVQIACKVTGFAVADGNTWWYRIASSPWNSAYYVSADAFYNNGSTSGSLSGTPFFDPAVPNC